MKMGKSLTQLASEIDRQQAAKHDYLANTQMLTVLPKGDKIAVNSKGEFQMTDLFHDQVRNRLDISAKYYDRMRREAPDLLAYNVNVWFQRKPEQRLVRTLDGKARAFLSNIYRTIDNFQLMQHILPLLADASQRLEVVSSEITEQKLYLKVTTPKLIGEVRQGDPVQAGFVISNSEVGKGSFSAMPYLVRLACVNGARIDDFGKRKYHVGKALEKGDEDVHEIFQDDTLKADETAFWLKIRDIVLACIEQTRFDMLIEKMKEADAVHFNNAEATVVEVTKRFGLGDGDKAGILTQLVNGGLGMTLYSLSNAVTAHANNVESYDHASTLEEIGGDLITLPAAERKALLV